MTTTSWQKPRKPQETLLQPRTRLQSLALWQVADPLRILAETFDPISLEQMDAVALLNRTDTKYMLTHSQLLAALAAVQNDYWMLAVNGQRLNHYRTLYFDTPNFDLYGMHVNERSNRYKVRSREYADTNLAFLEVKHKTPKGRTIKDRVHTQKLVLGMDLASEAWLEDVFPYDSRVLEPKLWNSFTRLTLVGKRCPERVTLDVDLSFQANGQSVQLDQLAVAEVKMDVCSQVSPFREQMHTQHIPVDGFSKYCIGIAMLYDQVKKNSLKPKLHKIQKITKGS